MASGSPPTVRIADADVQIVEYRGERVVTFKQIDKVHGRPDDTASRAFRENRDRFLLGVDFYEPTSDEIRRMSEAGVFPSRTARGKLITHRGYLKLVKSLNDDVAWKVFGEMVDRYFADDPAPRALPVPRAVSATELRRSHSYWLSIAERTIPDANAALFSANRMTRRATGIDVLEEMGVKLLPSPTDEVVLPPTAYCGDLGVKRNEINRLITRHGYQTEHRDHKDCLYYKLTKKGHEAGGRGLDRNIEHDKGTTMKVELKWPRSIVDRLRADIMAEAH